jgi:hypothetical protein
MSKKPFKKEALPRGNTTNNELSEEDRNLIGFFELLFDVDRRINPHLYASTNKQSND